MISVVSPVYQAEKILPERAAELKKVLDKLHEEYKIILVNDRSTDDSWDVMKKRAKQYQNLRIFRVRCNFGQHPTIMAGLSNVQGGWIGVMDCNLQEQPQKSEKLYNKALEAYDLVIAKISSRKDFYFKKKTLKLFSKIFNYLSDIQLDYNAANFNKYKKKLITEVIGLNDFMKSFSLFNYNLGISQTSIEVEHGFQYEGKPKYTYRKMTKLVVKSVLSFSDKTRRIVIQIGIFISIMSFLLGIFFLIYLYNGIIIIPCYTSIIVSLFFLSEKTISVSGFTGLNIGKTFKQEKEWHSFIIDQN